jgi:CRISPR-associated protein Csm3
MDYLGGHGSRGYGRVAFSNFEMDVQEGECPVDTDVLLIALKGAEKYGILSLQT